MTYNLIQKGALQERLSRGLGIQERSPAPTLDAVVQPVVILEDLTQQSPFVQPVDRRVWCGRSFTAAAGEFTYIALVNPAGSSCVAVLDFFSVTSATNFIAVAGHIVTPANLAAAVASGILQSCFYADPRNGVNGATAIQAWLGGDVNPQAWMLQSMLFRWSTGAIETARFQPPMLPFVIPPGFGWMAADDTANHAQNYTLSWREYVN